MRKCSIITVRSCSGLSISSVNLIVSAEAIEALVCAKLSGEPIKTQGVDGYLDGIPFRFLKVNDDGSYLIQSSVSGPVKIEFQLPSD